MYCATIFVLSSPLSTNHAPFQQGIHVSLDDAIRQLREMNERVPRPLRLPTQDEVALTEKQLGVKFHPDYRRYLAEASDIVFGTVEPATITRPESHTYLPKICAHAWAAGIAKDCLPICEDNGDYYCMNERGHVFFLSHNGSNSETWPDLATWIEEVWIGESGE